jgi:GNAT superfamily N-acetyltransferase
MDHAPFIFREARVSDIPGLMSVRMSVKENVLSNPALVTPKDNEDYLTRYGKGWLCETGNTVVGFAIVGLTQRNIWALFVHPDFEKMGIGRKLHDLMMDWYFSQTDEKVWLGTSPGTRAETFYRKSGWTENGTYGKEIKFEMTKKDWKEIQKNKSKIQS